MERLRFVGFGFGILVLVVAGCGGGGSQPDVCSLDNPNGECPAGQRCENGQCVTDAQACSAEHPNGECPQGETCLEGTCVADDQLCSALNPEGLCPAGRTCLDGVCRDEDLLCTVQNPTGLCTAGTQCLDGTCVAQAELCSQANPGGRCVAGQTCMEGSCLSNDLICSPLNPTGLCAGGLVCEDGSCVDPANECSPDHPNGTCPDSQTCLDGSCVSDDLLCGPDNQDGLCPTGQTCQGGMCIDEASVCSPQNPGGACDDGQTCLDGSCVSDDLLCSQANPSGLCPAGQTCQSGVCVDDADMCSPQNPNGSCVAGQTCLDGQCVADDLLCSPQNQGGLCPGGQTCLDGACQDDGDLCSLQNPAGLCPTGETCLEGSCVDDSLLCSPQNPNGLCPAPQVCNDGVCGDATEPCSPQHPNGICPAGQTCLDGTCEANADLCSPQNQDGLCAAGETCLDGACVDNGLVCSPGNPAGLCPSGQSCLDGACLDDDLMCSPQNPAGHCPAGETCEDGQCQAGQTACSPGNPTGICPLGQICVGGACQDLDGAGLCDDENDCTLDWFDFALNRCAHAAQDVPCSDGNACTNDACVAGVCQGTAIGGCIEPPIVDPVVSPTNIGTIDLTGQKEVGASIWINGQSAVPSDDQTNWGVQVDLAPGPNVYEIWSDQSGQTSESVTITIVYDITAPITSATPGGGVYETPVTVTVATDEPAVVYYTTNGSTPDASSASFYSVRTFRIFDDTQLQFYAVDLATNEESPIQAEDYEITDYANGWTDGEDLPAALIHPAVVSHNAVVYAIGGSDGNSAVDTVYQMDPLGGGWLARAPLPSPRSQATAVSYGSLIYVLGGEVNGIPLNTVSVYDPFNDRWNADAPPMPSTRYGLTAVRDGGYIYALGGKTNNGVVLDNLEIYSPGNEVWSNAAQPLPRPRTGLGAVVHNGSIYVLGGEDEAGVPIGELDVYAIGADSWSSGAPLPVPRAFAAVSLRTDVGELDSGHRGILVAGGRVLGGAATDRVAEYIFDLDTWRVRRPMPVGWHSGGSTSLSVEQSDHQYVWQTWLVGGQGPGGLSVASRFYDHNLEPWRRLATMPNERFSGVAAELNGLIYITAGRHHTDDTTCWIFDPETEGYSACADLPAVQKGAAAVGTGDEVLVVGGHNNFGQAIPTVHAYDPLADQWTERAPMLTGRRDLAVATLGGLVYAIGGDNNGPVQTVEVYDPADDSWTSTGALPAGRKGAAVVGFGGYLYLIGGVGPGDVVLDTILEYDPVNEDWTELGDRLAEPWAYGGALLSDDGLVSLLGGRVDGLSLAVDPQTFDLTSGQALSFLCSSADEILEPVGEVAAVIHHGKAYLFGGTVTGDEGTTLVQKYTPNRIVACPPECVDYMVLNQSWRNVSFGSGANCDDELVTRWYRFLAPAGTQMPDYAVSRYHCGTSATGWMNGSHPSLADGVVNRTACFYWNGSCDWSTGIQVLNCGSYYVYRLTPSPTCSLAYCAE